MRSVFARAFFLNAGGLWRDEAQLVHLSLLPSFSEMWQNLPHDSCPILMHLVVRAWSAAASFGNTDAGLRVLGLYVGLFLLLAFIAKLAGVALIFVGAATFPLRLALLNGLSGDVSW